MALKLHRMLSYGLMTAGAVVSARAIERRLAWEEANVHAGILLDWDDVQAVATRAGQSDLDPAGLLRRFREQGATHLALPELSLARLLARGRLSVEQGSRPGRVYLRAESPALAERVTAELQARLPHLQVECSQAEQPLVSFQGDLPTVAEVGLGFDPAVADLARQAGLRPVARPIGYSWVRPAMIDRSLDQAAALGAGIVAVQGDLIPGHEFEIQTTVAAMKRNRLRYAFFRERRHQKGDWFLAKSLAGEGLVILAHEFEPAEMLPEDSGSISYRWANLAVEAGVRLCSVRFFRVLHAADPLEALTYVGQLAAALRRAGLVVNGLEAVDLTPVQPRRDELALAMAGLSTAGAAGLAADLWPVSNSLKLLGLSAAALALSGLPLLERWRAARAQQHHHEHDHHHHHEHDHDHHHDDGHHHDHDHDHDHHHHHPPATAYAPKGVALAAMMAYPAAAVAFQGVEPLPALAQTLAVGAAGATALSVATVEDEYLLGVEEYRGFNLDWVFPLGLAAASELANRQPQRAWQRWLPLAGVALAALKSWGAAAGPDLPGRLDREHPQEHTHHLSAFQRAVGDARMALSLRPLRKWSLLAPLGVTAASILRRSGRSELAALALTGAAAGQVATMTGFRHGQRPLRQTFQGRARGWLVGAALAGVVWLGWRLFGARSGAARWKRR